MQDSPNKFELRQAKPNCLVLTCRGGLSWEDREALADAVEQYLDRHTGVAAVVQDLAEVTFINSAGLGALFQLCQRLRARGTVLAFANASPALKRLFHTIGLHHFAKIGGDLDTTVDSFTRSTCVATPRSPSRRCTVRLRRRVSSTPSASRQTMS